MRSAMLVDPWTKKSHDQPFRPAQTVLHERQWIYVPCRSKLENICAHLSHDWRGMKLHAQSYGAVRAFEWPDIPFTW